MMRVVLLAACSANVVAFATVPQKTTNACVDIGFPDDPAFKCADEAEACNDTSDLEWYNELRQICAKTCGECGMPPFPDIAPNPEDDDALFTRMGMTNSKRSSLSMSV